MRRYVFWLNNLCYEQVKNNPIIKQRITQVKTMRLNSKAELTQKAGRTPWAFIQKGEYTQAYEDFLTSKEDEFWQIIVPRVSSENRDYVPMGFEGEDTIISDSAMVIYRSPVWLLGLISSRLHMIWLRTVGGKMKTDYRYSALVYNTFPVPPLSTQRKNMIEEQILEILDLREEIGGTLAALYNNATMPNKLREAHEMLDDIVERAYLDRPFKNDNERLSLLLKMYKNLTVRGSTNER